MGIKYMHMRHIIHWDIKLENIMIKKERVKIGDFGCCV